MKRYVVVLAMMALLMATLAMPAFAVKGGEKPFTYGDCVSGVAAEGGDVQAVTKTMAPLQSKGEGTDGKFLIGCRY